MRLVGRPDLIEQPWFATGHSRAQHADELDDAVGGWIAARSDRRGARRLRGGRGGRRSGVRRARRDGRPAVRGDRHGADRRRRRARAGQDAERAVPHVRDAGRRSAGPAVRTAPTPPRCSARSASPPTSSPTCVSEESCDPAVRSECSHRTAASHVTLRSTGACTCRATGRSASTRRWRPAPTSSSSTSRMPSPPTTRRQARAARRRLARPPPSDRPPVVEVRVNAGDAGRPRGVGRRRPATSACACPRSSRPTTSTPRSPRSGATCRSPH